MASETATDTVPPLTRLAAAALCRPWLSARSPTLLDGLPTDLVKLVWKELRSLLKRHDRTPSCADMLPFVSTGWRVDTLDLTDASKWLTDASLGALSSLASLRTLRLTACRYVGDGGLNFCGALPLETLDISWTSVGDAGLAHSVCRCTSLTSLNLTGLHVSDGAMSSLLALTSLQRLSLASTPITDAALDYLTYYTRYPAAGHDRIGVHGLRWLELSNTRLSDTGVGKLVAIIEEGTPYGKVFKHLEYLGLSSTPNVTPSAFRQVRTKYGLDTPLPNAQRTLARSNGVALDAQPWVLRFDPSEGRGLPAPTRTWEQERVVAYIAAYTKEMAAAAETIAWLTEADRGGMPMSARRPPSLGAPPPPHAKRQRTG